jgi:teichoic acid transport system ATP-binding protein
MSDFAIQVENIGKVFRIYDKPSDRLKETFSFGKKKYYTDFQALRNISFNVKKGGFLGIVGKNGAGKSTLLKILSGELTPSEGAVTMSGNVSLLQLGVGFDTELTGIENARFASKLLGYSNREIDTMLKDIIEFADIGDFMYHPVKTYSSGMHSRLSFAVGVNINPDILIADEVLAVGDMRFSQKCLRKMREFKEKGKTIVLVTHDTSTVNVFCDSALWLMNGQIFQRGDAKSVSTNYMNYMLYDKLPEDYTVQTTMEEETEKNRNNPIEIDLKDVDWEETTHLSSIGDGRAEIRRIAFLLYDTMVRVKTINGNERVLILLDVLIKIPIDHPQVGIRINNRHGLVAIHTNNDIGENSLPPLKAGDRFITKFTLKMPSISNGSYTLSVGLQDNIGSQNNAIMPQLIEDVYEFKVQRTDSNSIQCVYVIIEEQAVNFVYT